MTLNYINKKLQQNKLFWFFAFTITWTWFFWILRSLILNQMIIIPISEEECKIFGGLGPILVAFILTFLTDGKEGVKSLLKRGLDYKFNKRLWIPLLFLTTVTTYLTYQLINIITPLPDIINLPIELDEFVGALIILLIISIAEEFGWRGYALDHLRNKFKSSNHTAIYASLTLGFIWSFWHLPLFVTPDEGKSHEIQYFPYFIIMGILLAILFTWFYNNSNRSILTAIVFHTSINFSGIVVPVTDSYAIPDNLGYIVLNLIILIFVIILILSQGSKNLVKSRLDNPNIIRSKTISVTDISTP